MSFRKMEMPIRSGELPSPPWGKMQADVLGLNQSLRRPDQSHHYQYIVSVGQTCRYIIATAFSVSPIWSRASALAMSIK